MNKFIYTASKLDEHEQWVGPAGPSQKAKPTNQAIGTELLLLYAVKILLRPVYLGRCFKVGISISVQNDHKSFVNI